MKYLNKLMVFFLFMLFSYGVDTFAYTYSIANMTGRGVNVQLHWVKDTLNRKGGTWVNAFDTRKFNFGGWQVGLCLNKIIAKSFDEQKDHWIELPVPIKIIDRQLFDDTKDIIGRFTNAVKEIGKVVALAGAAGKAVATAVQALPELVSSVQEIWSISFCRGRDFILILDYDPLIKMNRIHALTPPE